MGAVMDLKSLFNRRSVSNERRAKQRLPKSRVIKVLVVDDSRTVHQPDIILMDVIMPGLNGFQATRKIRKDPSTHSIPIIIISATEQPTEQFWLTKLGANDFLSKPIIRSDLFTKVETQLYPRQVVA
jgi:CheY-like chemotaxis protein